MAVDMPERDGEGYLIDPSAWNEEIAKVLAKDENIELNDDHWDAIRFMREFYEEHQIAADARYVIWHLAESMGKDAQKDKEAKREAQKKLLILFPYGYVKQACKIAGMRRPRAWSTG